MTKMTKAQVINGMLNGFIAVTDEVAVNYLKNELALIEKKAQNKKATKTQEANVGLKATILNVLASVEKATVSEILKADVAFEGLSNQKISALVKQLVDAGEVVKTTEKKVSYFALANEGE